MTLPTFACIGAQRCGTTWLYDCLTMHPDVFLCEIKDVAYFRRWRGERSLYDIHGIGLYEDLFKSGEGYSVRGDVSAGLLSGVGVAETMCKHMPECRLIAILRNPIDRAFSHYHYVKSRRNVQFSFEELVNNPQLNDPDEILHEGKYAVHFSSFFNYYPRDQWLILFYDELTNAEQMYIKICSFLKVESEYKPPTVYTRSNERTEYRSKLLLNIGQSLGRLLFTSRFTFLRRMIKNSGITALIQKLNTQPRLTTPSKMDLRTRNKLIEYYRRDIVQLEQLLGKNLQHWIEPS